MLGGGKTLSGVYLCVCVCYLPRNWIGPNCGEGDALPPQPLVANPSTSQRQIEGGGGTGRRGPRPSWRKEVGWTGSGIMATPKSDIFSRCTCRWRSRATSRFGGGSSDAGGGGPGDTRHSPFLCPLYDYNLQSCGKKKSHNTSQTASRPASTDDFVHSRIKRNPIMSSSWRTSRARA